MPEVETEQLIEAYGTADTILEYGSGGSTILACLLGKRVYSVESDIRWADDLSTVVEHYFDKGRAVIAPVDIGPTKAWSYPVDCTRYAAYSNYPNAVWDRDDFGQPDLILIDGRFRAACLMSALQRVSRPTRVLFDDYAGRPHYHWVEGLAKPVAMHGRMAEFRIDRLAIPDAYFSRMIAAYADIR